MRFTYILSNVEGRGSRLPRGEAWQWLHEFGQIGDLSSVLDWIDMRVSIDHLRPLNFYLDHAQITAPKNDLITFSCKSSVMYSYVTTPNRVIDMRRLNCFTTNYEKQYHVRKVS